MRLDNNASTVVKESCRWHFIPKEKFDVCLLCLLWLWSVDGWVDCIFPKLRSDLSSELWPPSKCIISEQLHSRADIGHELLRVICWWEAVCLQETGTGRRVELAHLEARNLEACLVDSIYNLACVNVYIWPDQGKSWLFALRKFCSCKSITVVCQFQLSREDTDYRA
jgi:hypothetical protein